jgi:capsular polysaccharide biosynthesis protein
MSGQALDLKRSAQMIRRHRTLVVVAAALGLMAGAAYTALNPPTYTSSAFVAVTPSVSTASQPVIVTSAPVLSLALSSVGPGVSLAILHGRVHAQRVAAGLTSVSASGNTPAQAVVTANAVARSYVMYISSAGNVAGQLPAEVFQPATAATGTALPSRLFYAGGPGVLAGALIGAIIALAVGRNHRRLRTRDEIADSIGVPVLASVRVCHPSKAADWTKLLDRYEPEATDACRLRKVLCQLGAVGPAPANVTTGSDFTLAALSLSCDRRALALGPQLAVFAASLGIPTALVVGPQQDANTAAALRAACAAAPQPSRLPGNLRVIVNEHGDVSQLPEVVLTVVVGVVDGQAPLVASTMRATATVLSVASGAVTAQQLARVAASAAGDGRAIAGILVADPDAADQTTGRIPQLARPGQYRMPTRMTGAVTEAIR